MSEAVKPKNKWVKGNVSLTEWENHLKDKDGKEFTTTSYKLQKSYKDKDGNWKTTDSMKENELVNAMILIEKALLSKTYVPEEKTE